MTLDDLINEILEFSKERDWGQFHSPKNLSMAVSAEAAELLEIFMWLKEDESRSLTADQQAATRDEVGDVLICLVHLAAKLGIDPLQAAHEKMRKNRKKYPVEKSRGSAQKYDKL